MPSAWLTNFMASLDANPSVRQPTTQEIAADIIRRSNRYRYTLPQRGVTSISSLSASSNKPGEKGPSTVQRIMDILSRPLYGSANLMKEGLSDAKRGDLKGAIEHTPNLVGAALNFEDVWQGLSGKKKTTSRDIFKEAGLGEGHGVGGFARNLAGDILFDPTTYIPGGALISAFRGAKAAPEIARAATATERVEEALNSPKNILARSSSNKSVPNVAKRNITRPQQGAEELTGTPDLWKDLIDPSPVGPSSVLRGTSSSRNIPGVPRAIGDARPAINRAGVNEPSGIPDLWRNLLGETPVIPQKVAPPTVVQKTLADVVPNPTRKINVEALGVPPRAGEVLNQTKFKLDVNKVASIEIARAIAPKTGNSRAEFNAAQRLIDSEGAVPVYSLSGKQIGELDGFKVREYLKTGKIDAPKESDIPDYATASPEEISAFEGHLFSEKDAPKNFYFKNIEGENESLISLAEVRKRVVAAKKNLKLKDEVADEVITTAAKPADTTAWRKAAKEAGLTQSEINRVLKAGNDDDALRLLQEFADKPIKLPAARVSKAASDLPEVEDFKIADAEDLVDAIGEGSSTAAKAVDEGASQIAPRNVVLDEIGGQVVNKVAEHYASLVRQATFRNSNFNPAKQANAFRMLEAELVKSGKLTGFRAPEDKLISTSTGKIAQRRRSITMQHLTALEDAMTKLGHPPMTFGMKGAYPLRMSDLINAAGGIHVVLANKGVHLTDLFGNQTKLDKFLAANPEAAQLAEKAQAAHAITTASLIEDGQDAAISAAQKAETDLTKTATEVAQARSGAPAVAGDVVRATAEYPNPEAIKLAADSVRNIIEGAKPPVHKVVERYASAYDRTVLTGKVGEKTVAGSVAQTRAVHDLAGIPVQGIKSEISKADDALASQGLTARLLSMFKPDFRQVDLRPINVEKRSLYQANTGRWAHALSQTFKKYDKATRRTAFEALQKGMPVGDDVTRQAAKEFQDAMESMFGASGVKSAVDTDVLREAITMEDMNRALRMRHVPFQFTNKVKNELGEEVKVPWLDSWKYHKLEQDPVEFIKGMRDAVDLTMLEKTMFDEIATVWGKPGRTQFAHPRLTGIQFDPDTRKQVSQFLKMMEEAQRPNSKFAQNYDAALRIWKTGVTIYSPSHHIRNLVGDISLAWLAGVNNPKVYSKAASVLRANRHLYDDMAKIDELVSPGGTTRALSRQAKQPIVRAGGKQLDASQVYQIAYDRGLLPHSKTIEDIPGGREIKLPQPLGGRGKKVARGVSETREHYVRLAHFIDALGKSKARTINQAIDEATRITRKWHPDGLDLTDFEHRYVRRVFPFYSWTRKAIPLIVEGAVKRPSKIIAPNKALYNLQVSMGLDPESLSEPFPVDKEFPDWIRDMAYGPVLGGGSTIIGSNLNPVTSVTEQLGNDPRRGIAGLLTPAIRVPGELLSQSDWQTGQPMDTMDKTEYIDKQVPMLSIANRIGQGNFGAGSVEALATGNQDAMFNHKRTEGTGGENAGTYAFLNYLLAAGLIDTQTPANLKSAEFDRRDRLARR